MATDALTLLLAKKPPPGSSGGGAPPSDGGDRQELRIAMKDFLAAVKANDASAAADAFESLHAICDSYDDSKSGG